MDWVRVLVFLAALTASAAAESPASRPAASAAFGKATIASLTWRDARGADAAASVGRRFGVEAGQDIMRLPVSDPARQAPVGAAADPVQQLVGEWRADPGSACTSSPWRFRIEGDDLVWQRTVGGQWEEYVRRPTRVLNGNHVEFVPRQGNAFEVLGDEMYLEFNGSFGDRQCHFRKVATSAPSTGDSTQAAADPVRQLVGEWRADPGSGCSSSPWRFRIEGDDLVWERTVRSRWEEYVRRPTRVLNGNHVEFVPRQGNAFEVLGDEMYLEFNGSFGDRQCHFRRYR